MSQVRTCAQRRYDYINSFILDYIVYSIDVPPAGGFYWYIIALQDLLRATEYTGASVVYAIHYYVNGNNSIDNLRNYIVLDALQVFFHNNNLYFLSKWIIQKSYII